MEGWMTVKIGATMALPSMLLMMATLTFFDSGGRYEFIVWQQNLVKTSFLGMVLGSLLMLAGLWMTP